MTVLSRNKKACPTTIKLNRIGTNLKPGVKNYEKSLVAYDWRRSNINKKEKSVLIFNFESWTV